MKTTTPQLMTTAIVVSGIVLFAGAGCTPVEPVITINPVVTDVAMPDSWSTFTSPLLEYSITYPSTWYTWSGSERFEDMQEAESDVDYFSILSKEDSFTIAADQIFIGIDRDTKQALVPGEAATESFNDIIAANSQAETVSDVQALVVDGNLPAVQQVEQDPDDTTGEYGYKMVTYVDVDNMVYTIHVTTASAADYARYVEIIQIMIASFDYQAGWLHLC